MNVLVYIPSCRPPDTVKEHYASVDALGVEVHRSRGTWDAVDFRADNVRRLNEGRSLALVDYDADAMLVIEDDMVLPDREQIGLLRHTMIERDGGVVYAFSCCRQYPFQWTPTIDLEADGRNYSVSHVCGASMLRALEGGLLRVQGCGLFCTLIHRSVLERIPFRRDGRESADFYFARDCMAAGIEQWADLRVVCGHISGDEILYPDSSKPGWVRREKRA